MSPKQFVERMAVTIGATVRDGLDVAIEAPPGTVWQDGGCHEIIGSQWDDESRVDVWRDLRDRMKLGVERCLDAHCEWCAENDNLA